MASPTNAAAASSSSSSLSLSSTDQNHYAYEVFLSFRGEDTRFGFTDHLYKALLQRVIETFRDDKLSRGEDISQELLNAIDKSRASIVVFSENYASSRWCLDELVKILDCRNVKGQKFRAVFYKVAPSDVRHQTGPFRDAFAKIDQCKYEDSMGKWKAALKEAADLSGWTYKDGMYESKFIDDIVKELSTQVIIPSYDLDVAEHPVGLESCIQDVNRLLKAEENIVRMVAIWGTGGIGKSTIAKAVFNLIHHKFEGSCFLENVRSNSSSTSNGLAELQEKLLVNILRDPNLKVSSVDQGVSIIKATMRKKKVLLVLDDVSHSKQLKSLVPSFDFFGSGSRILITTRDKGWLTAHRVGDDELYEVKMLEDDQALKLFSLHAFQSNGPIDGYQGLARRVVHYAKGLPLALIVLGSHLFGGSREEWEATLDSCNGEDPHREIRDILKISYDALGVELQEYFLDIACFFNGMLVHSVKPILEACHDLNSEIGIKKLQDKALIRIDHDTRNGGWIWMHDLIEEMGKDIVYQESPREPGQRSRVWTEDDVNDILTNNTGTNKVIGIQLSWRSSLISLNAKSFSEMKQLRYISMGGSPFSGDIDYLSNQLRWLDWQACSLQCFPSDFQANKLVELKITNSCEITQLWEGRKKFSRLTRMNLSGCTSLKELPDFSGFPNLKRLGLYKCTSLVEVPDSIRFLHNLEILLAGGCTKLAAFPKIPVKMDSLGLLSLKGSDIRELDESIENLIGLEHLDLTYCKNLTTLPCSIYGLHNLKSLGAIGCSKLATFPKIPVKMDSLRLLSLKGSDIRELDESIENLIGLEYLDLRDCKNLTTLPCSIYGLQNLWFLDLGECSKLVRFPTNTKILNVDGCSLSLPKLGVFSIAGCSLLSDCDFLMTLDCWETLWWLNLSRNNFVSLPACLTKFVKLRNLNLSGCKRLREIPELPPNVIPQTWGCKSLETEAASPSDEDDCESLETEAASPSDEDDDEEEPIPELPPYISGCELLEERFSTSTNRGAVIGAASPSIEEPTPSSWLSLSSETPKRHRTTEEPSTTPVNTPKRHRAAEEPSPAELFRLSLSTEPTSESSAEEPSPVAGGQASMVHSAREMAISPIQKNFLSKDSGQAIRQLYPELIFTHYFDR